MENLESELQEINDRLNNINKKIDDTGKQFSDNTPLQNIKKSISAVKNDIKNIDIRIGVVSNTLLQLKLKERSKVIEDGKALEILDNEYEIEMWQEGTQINERSARISSAALKSKAPLATQIWTHISLFPRLLQINNTLFTALYIYIAIISVYTLS